MGIFNQACATIAKFIESNHRLPNETEQKTLQVQAFFAAAADPNNTNHQEAAYYMVRLHRQNEKGSSRSEAHEKALIASAKAGNIDALTQAAKILDPNTQKQILTAEQIQNLLKNIADGKLPLRTFDPECAFEETLAPLINIAFGLLGKTSETDKYYDLITNFNDIQETEKKEIGEKLFHVIAQRVLENDIPIPDADITTVQILLRYCQQKLLVTPRDALPDSVPLFEFTTQTATNLQLGLAVAQKLAQSQNPDIAHAALLICGDHYIQLAVTSDEYFHRALEVFNLAFSLPDTKRKDYQDVVAARLQRRLEVPKLAGKNGLISTVRVVVSEETFSKLYGVYFNIEGSYFNSEGSKDRLGLGYFYVDEKHNAYLDNRSADRKHYDSPGFYLLAPEDLKRFFEKTSRNQDNQDQPLVNVISQLAYKYARYLIETHHKIEDARKILDVVAAYYPDCYRLLVQIDETQNPGQALKHFMAYMRSNVSLAAKISLFENYKDSAFLIDKKSEIMIELLREYFRADSKTAEKMDTIDQLGSYFKSLQIDSLPEELQAAYLSMYADGVTAQKLTRKKDAEATLRNKFSAINTNDSTISTDNSFALALYKTAAALGDPEAVFRLMELYETNQVGRVFSTTLTDFVLLFVEQHAKVTDETSYLVGLHAITEQKFPYKIKSTKNLASERDQAKVMANILLCLRMTQEVAATLKINDLEEYKTQIKQSLQANPNSTKPMLEKIIANAAGELKRQAKDLKLELFPALTATSTQQQAPAAAPTSLFFSAGRHSPGVSVNNTLVEVPLAMLERMLAPSEVQKLLGAAEQIKQIQSSSTLTPQNR